MIADLVRKSRTYRRFYQDVPISEETLRGLVDLARLSPSGRNAQPLKYKISWKPETNEKIFPTLGWAGYLKEWGGPVEGERPAGYIIILGDKEIAANYGIDHGIACQSIMLGAVEQGLGGCIIQSVRRTELAQVLDIPERYEILLVLALGKPKEEVVMVPIGPDGDIKYYRDANQVHYVPKRTLDEVLLP